MKKITFPDLETAKLATKEVGMTPDGVIMWAGSANPDFELDAEESVVGLPVAEDGTVTICFNFSDADWEWLKEKLVGKAELSECL